MCLHVGMQAQVWTPLVGVAVGGVLAFLAQTAAARHTARSDERRRTAERAEVRRAERLELLREFIALAQHGIRSAEQREDAADWDAAGTPEWLATARGLIDRLWVCERLMEILFPPHTYRYARAYATAVDQVLWREYDRTAKTMWDVVRGPQVDFLDAAHAALDSAATDPSPR